MSGVFTDLLGTVRNTFKLGPKASQLTLSSSALTAPRTISFPDAPGILALTSDLTGGSYTPWYIADATTRTVQDYEQLAIGMSVINDGYILNNGYIVETT